MFFVCLFVFVKRIFIDVNIDKLIIQFAQNVYKSFFLFRFLVCYQYRFRGKVLYLCSVK